MILSRRDCDACAGELTACSPVTTPAPPIKGIRLPRDFGQDFMCVRTGLTTKLNAFLAVRDRHSKMERYMKTVADQFVQTLSAAGVKRIYGVVGDSLNGLTDAVRRRGDIEWIHTRHEEAAAFAAGAEAHLTGELAVCAGSCGPGNLHLINGLFEAHRSCVPVVAIAAQIPSAEIGRGYFQETHPDQLFRECSHYCELISHPSQLPAVLEAAIRAAVGHRGVAVVVIPGDVALQKISAAASAAPAIAIERPRVLPSER